MSRREIVLSVALVSNDAARREHVSCCFPAAEWDTLLAFHADTELLRSTRFVQNKRGGEVNISWAAGSAASSQAERVDMDEVWSMLLKLRPFVLHRERHYFHAVKNLLKRRLTHTAFRKHIDLLEDAFTLRAMQKRLDLRVGIHRPLSVEVVMNWLNAFEYHKDQSKRLLAEEALDLFGGDQNGLPVILFGLVDMIQSTLAMGSLVETLMEVQMGKRSEIACPPEFFVET